MMTSIAILAILLTQLVPVVICNNTYPIEHLLKNYNSSERFMALGCGDRENH